MVRTRHSGDFNNDDYEEHGQFVSLNRVRRTKDVPVDSESESDDEVKVRRFKPQRKVTTASTSRGRSLSSFTTRRGDRDDISRGNSQSRNVDVRRRRNSLDVMNGYDEGEGDVRRSSRHRKLVYDTFNEKDLENCIPLHQVENGPSINNVNDDEDAEDENETSPEVPDLGRSLRKRAREVEPIDEDGLDMYTRVKRPRYKIKRDMYGMPIHGDDDNVQRVMRRKLSREQEEENDDDDDNGEDDEDEENDNDLEDDDDDDDEGDDDDDDDEGEEDEGQDHTNRRKQYFLREHKPKTQPFVAAPAITKRPKPPMLSTHRSPARRTHDFNTSYRSPARQTRRRTAFHGSSSTSSSSSSDSSEDERRFQRRKAKSMSKSRNRCLPMNLNKEDVSSGVLHDRLKVGASLADVDPMSIDRSVTFQSVGGLRKHIRALKEMIVFPLLYPEVFDRFKITPPRGVLFYGPPGTGKTLVARALANECSTGEKRVAFFMRKGADCLSKWVGESERQLRLLFDQAYQVRPSIIFFDEIDGLAPVRSSRQDQIHSSIVSTLLALMDGLDSRGEIVVIGATNRLDSIDPALRRPGRFDREFLFGLPSATARADILRIHTNKWEPKLVDPFIQEVARQTVGYCGADIKALCTEAALCALRRRYPQIYTSSDKLQLDVSSIQISASDFQYGMQSIVPTAQRSVASPGRSLSPALQTLLHRSLLKTLKVLQKIFPAALAQLSSLIMEKAITGEDDSVLSMDEFYSDEDEDEPAITENPKNDLPHKNFMSHFGRSYKQPITHRPRLLITGTDGQGHTSHLAPAILHQLEKLPVHVLDLPALYAVAAKTPEESVAQIFLEAKRTSPCIMYIPHICQWWDVVSDTLRATFLCLLRSLQPTTPLLLLATSNEPHETMDEMLKSLFCPLGKEVVVMDNPYDEERKAFFEQVLIYEASKAPSQKKQAAERQLEELPIAPPMPPRQLTDIEKKRLFEQEEKNMRELRLFLRDVINKLSRDRKFSIFAKPVDIDEVTDYYEIIKNPMDLSTMMSKIDLHCYETVKDFTNDIDLICSNALEYNPDRAPADKAIRHRACALRDTTFAILTAELNEEFEKECEQIKASRQKRGAQVQKNIPSFYHVKPVDAQQQRFSHRIRGIAACEEPTENLDASSKDNAAATRNSEKESQTPQRSSASRKADEKAVSDARNRSATKVRKANCIYRTRREMLEYVKKRNKLSPWCRSRSGRNRRKVIIISESESEAEEKDDGEKGNEEKQNGEENDDAEEERGLEKLVSGSENDKDEDETRCRSSSPRVHIPVSNHNELSNIEKTLDKLEELSPSSATIVERDHPYNVSPQSKSKVTSPVPQPPVLINEDSNKENDPDHTEETVQTEGLMETEVSNITNKGPAEFEEKDSEETLTFRLTRARKNSGPNTARARQILENPVPSLIVDKDELRNLLQSTVERTRGYNVEKLERLHCMFSQCIFEHRRNYDKSALINDLKQTLLNFTSQHQ
ncbi:ATPase family AAA domain-containing protein 2-like [Tubulanus polymorphus]|uniref:ATPase family AAA domain-containing protein 2-like n=1 Tax=Tubulanus polymorphus TaxID=672921 RepID=UPI003DA57953